ncbi:pilus assembly protein [Myxococcus sp. K38C18041901]|uniref:TadE/TadG family type IV pilus assembly protein n=1 Tax=Myxococcus guangdongensis TaxID=2906760 RepID=UPI0020A83701|nr:TadE/TadG family type IV pilus assembly protein [Myxococcus guangdongensis]MCP3058876.1 pilus assembly protein [Myxococcus guangdongensis]
MTTPAITRRGQVHLGRRARRGAATTEFAILTPVFVLLILGTTYFWEVQHVRLKAAEVVRYVAFERTVRSDVNRIVSEARTRYQDLDGTTKTGSRPTGLGHRNRVTLDIQAEDTEASLQDESLSGDGRPGGAMQGMSVVLGALGSTAGKVAQAMGLDPNRGAVRAQVEVRIENGLIPSQLAFLTRGVDDPRLDVTFKESFFLVHDTWRAWNPGDHPANTYPRVEELTYLRVRQIAYAGLASQGGTLDAIGAVLSVLGLDFPLKSDYLRDSVSIKSVKDSGRYMAAPNTDTRTVPGDRLFAAYWRSDIDPCFNGCEPEPIKEKRGLKGSSEKGHYNWPMRAYNCRGDFFQGAAKSDAPESEYALSKSQGKEYFNYGNFACADGPNTSRDNE